MGAAIAEAPLSASSGTLSGVCALPDGLAELSNCLVTADGALVMKPQLADGLPNGRPVLLFPGPLHRHCKLHSYGLLCSNKPRLSCVGKVKGMKHAHYKHAARVTSTAQQVFS